MATVRVGEADLDLRVVGAGLKGAALPERLGGVNNGWDLDIDELADLEAFEAAGWRFHSQADLNWREAKERHGEDVQAGLLARHPRGGLVILLNHLIASLPLGLLPDGVFSNPSPLPLDGNFYDLTVPLPDIDLEGALDRSLDALRKVANGLDQSAAEPLILYHLVQRGQLFNVSIDESLQWQWPKIGLPGAWAAAGSFGRQIRVAVIDLGFDLHEPQIRPNIAETAFVKADGTRMMPPVIPPDGHGTFCAGLIAALHDNVTVNGAAPECTLMLVAVESVTTQVGVAKAIELCVQGINGGPGADVISCSLGPTAKAWDLSAVLQLAIDKARNTGRATKGTTIVWSDFDADKPIPPLTLEAYHGILCVGESDRYDLRKASGYGPGLDLLAPAAAVTGIVSRNGVSQPGCASGSSFAAPCVAGVAALILAKKSTLTVDQVADLLTKNCDPVAVNKTRNDDQGWGRLNAARAVQMA